MNIHARIFAPVLTLLLSLTTAAASASAQQPEQFPELKPKSDPDAAESQPRRSGSNAETGEEDRDFSKKRDQWFIGLRAYPFEHIPAGMRDRALRQHQVLRQATHSTWAVSRARTKFNLAVQPFDSFTSLQWSFDGPAYLASSAGQTAYSGRATSLAIDPGNSQIMYLGTAGGGVWKTADSGSTWIPLTDSQASLAIGAITVDPNNSSIIYVGTGEADYSGDSYFGEGLLKSTNGGVSWTQISAPFVNNGSAAPFAQIAIQPGNSNVLLAATQSGLYRSANAGATWTNLLPSYVSAVIFDPRNPNVAYAGMNGYWNSIVYGNVTAAMYKSTDGGSTWAPITGGANSPLPAGNLVYRTSLYLDSAGNLLAGIAPSSGGSGTPYKSSDGGNTWTALTAPGDGLDWYRDWIVSVPGFPSVLYTGGVNLFESVDGGVSWQKSSESYATLLWADQHAAVFSPDGSRMYLMDDGGIFMTSAPATYNPQFLSLNNSIGSMTFYPGFAFTGANSKTTLVGAQDHGTQIGAAGTPWTYAGGGDVCGDGGPVVVDSEDAYAYAHCEGSPLSNWMVSPTAGAALGQGYPYGWASADSGINTGDRTAWVPPIAIDPGNAANVYTGTYRVYQSLNHAASWTAISSDLTSGSATLNTLAVAPSDPNTIYAGAGDGTVSVTTNALSGTAASWTTLHGLPNRSISKIVVMPDNPKDVYIAVGGFGSGHLFHSTDGGVTWKDLSGNLPDSPVNSLAIDPSLLNTIYLATDTGVYVTSNLGSSWEVLGSNLPNVVVQDIQIAAQLRLLRVVTHGRGAWSLTLPSNGFLASTNLLAFGTQGLQTTSASQAVTLFNNLSVAVSLSSITASTGFTATSTCGGSLAAGETCAINATFTPVAIGPISGTLTIQSSQGNISVALTGAGVTAAPPSLSIAPLSLQFNPQPLGWPSASQPVILTNTGASALAISSIKTTGDYAETDNCGSTLAAGTACAVSVTFTPTATGSRNGTLVITDNAAGSPQSLQLSSYGDVQSTTSELRFVPVTPCRIADTRNASGPFGGPELGAGATRTFNIPQSACGIPTSAAAYSVNVTVVPNASLNYLTVWPAGTTQPYVSTLNSDGRVKANAAIVPAGSNGGISVFASDATHVILDVDGYFAPANTASALEFYPVTPCRIADTRNAAGTFGGPYLTGGAAGRAFPLQSSACGLPATAKAYSLNVTAVPHGSLNYLTVWPAGQTQPNVSTLNSPTGAVTANAAIVPAGTGGAVSVFAYNDADVILDVNGYFAPPAPGGLSLFTVTPCRAIDTRNGSGAFNGILSVLIEPGQCVPAPAAQSYVFNATVVPSGFLNYLTLWANGATQPYVSTLNALDGAISSNMAIVPNFNGTTESFSSNSTNLILDLYGYFAP